MWKTKPSAEENLLRRHYLVARRPGRGSWCRKVALNFPSHAMHNALFLTCSFASWFHSRLFRSAPRYGEIFQDYPTPRARCLPPSSFSCATLRLPCVCGGPAAARRGRIKAAPHPIHIPFPGNKPHTSTQAERTLPFSFTCYFCKPNRGINVEEIEQTRNTASRLRKRV